MVSGALHLGPRTKAQASCVIVHGRGQSPEEMQSHILARLDAPDVAFVLPRAAKGAWYAAKAVDPLTSGTRAALGAALNQLEADVEEAKAAYPGLPLLLAGFSQGACLSLEYAFAGLSGVDALIAFTGCRVGRASDDRPASLRNGLPVYLTGSDADPWIPVTAFAEAALELGRGRAKLRADLFPGRGHEVSDAEIDMMRSVLADLAGGQNIGMAAAR
ncbi:alpha/beta hydrolase [Mesorhizobium sp. J428]|uniref:alpha/beta hydrolase n=1 Tax=Mesorhizobium sp. J428 TaxID=2898440 RepID=UPI002151812B|nr:phospholipase [Mesorhizobium sp. J428]MCR5856302.1 phospholipase [Mesorhizobium sp. J428]